ncbi:hypothetical protein [Ginsengibacter hankyongi]|nr:hypothetical protein [Ginsengibacter hankyongi]
MPSSSRRFLLGFDLEGLRAVVSIGMVMEINISSLLKAIMPDRYKHFQ